MTTLATLPFTSYQIADTQSVDAITGKLNRHLRGQRLRRVELRHTTAAGFDPGAVRAAISGLLRQQGLGQVEVSVRPIENPLDNAAGQHLLSLFELPKPPGLWGRLLGQLKRLLGSRQVDTARTEPALRAPTSPTLPAQKAIEALKAASHLAHAAFRKQHGSNPPAAVRVVVRDAALHATLAPLIQPRAPSAADWFARELQPGVPTLPGHWQVAYHYEAPPADDASGTALMGGSDIEVSLLQDAGSNLADGTAMPHFASTALPGAGDETTAMPNFATPAPRWQLRVLGTYSHKAGLRPYARPLLADLPSHISRSSLKAAGLEQLDANALAVSSEKSPLVCQQSAQGLSISVPQRTGPDGQTQPMYYTYPEGLPLGPIQLSAAQAATSPLRVLVNSPAGAAHPQTGQALPALLLELGLFS